MAVVPSARTHSLKKLLYFWKPTTKVCFEYPASIKNVSEEIIKCLSESEFLNVIDKRNDEQWDVKIVFCSIVFRAGNDIKEALSRLSADKPTIMFVLHHTFDPNYNAPNSRRYERNNLVMVDILFHEDSGMLKCSKNDEAISRARNYLKKYAKHQLAVSTNEQESFKPVFAVCSVVVVGLLFIYIYKW